MTSLGHTPSGVVGSSPGPEPGIRERRSGPSGWLVLSGAIALGLLLTWPWLVVEGARMSSTSDGTADDAQRAVRLWRDFLQPTVGCLLFGAIGAVTRRRVIPVAATVLTMVLGWWIGDQFDWVSGALSGAHAGSGGSGLYPATWAGIGLVEAAFGSGLGWFLGGLVRRVLAGDPV